MKRQERSQYAGKLKCTFFLAKIDENSRKPGEKFALNSSKKPKAAKIIKLTTTKQGKLRKNREKLQ